MATTMLLEAVEAAAADLDTANRAWVISIGRLVDNVSDEVFHESVIRSVVDQLYLSGEYPAGPLGYVPDVDQATVAPDYRMMTVTHDLDGRPYLCSKVAFGISGFVAQGFTRSGVLENEREPSHVLLVDVEAAIADIVNLTAHVARAIDYSGLIAVLVGVASAVPGRPLRLRWYDEVTGDLAPPDQARSSFTPVLATAAIDPDLNRAAFHRLCYGMAEQAAAQFGVGRPQLILDPADGTPEQGDAAVYQRNPFAPPDESST